MKIAKKFSEANSVFLCKLYYDNRCMSARSIAGWALIAVGAFFIFMTTELTIHNIFADMEEGYAVAGAIQTQSGMIIAAIGGGALFAGLKLRKPKRAVIPA